LRFMCLPILTPSTKLHGGTPFLHLGHLPLLRFCFHTLHAIPIRSYLYHFSATTYSLTFDWFLSTYLKYVMVHVRVGNPAAGDQRFLATTCTNLHGGFVPIFTAASRRRREGLVATLTTYLTHTIEYPYLHSQFQRHLVYHTSRRHLVYQTSLRLPSW
jgi:hypothetical protein